MDAYRLPPPTADMVSALPHEDRRAWFETEYPTLLASMSVADLLFVANGTTDYRFTARPLLMDRMTDAGLSHGPNDTCLAPCCGQPYEWRSTASALAHITHSPCSRGFRIVEGRCVCDCKRTFATPQEAHEHQRKIGNCLDYRRTRQALFCTLCEHQCESKKDLEAHTQSKSHLKLEHPVKLHCEVCEVSCRTPNEYARHCEGKLHKFRTDPATRPMLTCSVCKITCSSQRKYDAHLTTAKHLKKTTSVCVVG